MQTGSISSQFHVVFDELFTTIHSVDDDDTDIWVELFTGEREYYGPSGDEEDDPIDFPDLDPGWLPPVPSMSPSSLHPLLTMFLSLRSQLPMLLHLLHLYSPILKKMILKMKMILTMKTLLKMKTILTILLLKMLLLTLLPMPLLDGNLSEFAKESPSLRASLVKVGLLFPSP